MLLPAKIQPPLEVHHRWLARFHSAPRPPILVGVAVRDGK
jgi:hypothetical protein